MDIKLQEGERVKTLSGDVIEVVSLLSDTGGQGLVYKVLYRGEEKVLKWYKPEAISDPGAFYDNLVSNAGEDKAPSEAFVWPLAVTEKVVRGVGNDGVPVETFGYVMDLIDMGRYREFTQFQTRASEVYFPTFRANVEAMMRIVQAFSLLHRNGYCYQDINDGNFCIHPKSGKVLVCDNDNVAPDDGRSAFVLGKPRWMAPEIVVGKALPSTSTDLWSLSVVLFFILCMNHPLEGRRWFGRPAVTEAGERRVYGSKPVFIFDPDDDSNRPLAGYQNNPINRWPALPGYVRDAFMRAFSKEAVENPGRRIAEVEWLKILARFQGDIVRCHGTKPDGSPCESEVFLENAESAPCDVCGRPARARHALDLPSYTIAASRKARVYRCQMGVCNAENALDRVVTVTTRGEGHHSLLLRNETKEAFTCFLPSGEQKVVEPGRHVPLKAGIKVRTPYGDISIR